MNRNKIRHKILKMLVDNYQEVDEKYGEGQGFFLPSEEHRLGIPINTIVEKLKIPYHDYDQAVTKAYRDKTVKRDDTNDVEECLTIAENTFLYYYERIYLNQKSQWKEKYPLLYDLIIIIVTAIISIITTVLISKYQRQKDQEEQNQTNMRQDSIIKTLQNALKEINTKEPITTPLKDSTQ